VTLNSCSNPLRSVLFGVTFGIWVHADEAQVMSPRWVVVLTITDRITGAELEQDELQMNDASQRVAAQNLRSSAL
jgi:hypothetical protein